MPQGPEFITQMPTPHSMHECPPPVMDRISPPPVSAPIKSNPCMDPRLYATNSQIEWYDHLLFGFGQILRAKESIFANPQRIGDPDLTNFSKAGELSNSVGVEICGICCHTHFVQHSNAEVPAGAPSASRLYDLFNTYTRLTIIQDKVEKTVIPLHRIPSGGGITGVDVENPVKLQGQGGSLDLYRFDKDCRIIVPPGGRFMMRLDWMSGLPGGNVYPGGFNPLELFNSNTTAEKLVRFGVIGIEVTEPM